MPGLIFMLLVADFAGNIVSVWRGNKTGRYVTKPLLMPLLLIFYIVTAKSINAYIIAALAAGFLGDVFLLFDEKIHCFIMGIISFMLGHGFYIIAFIEKLGGMDKVPLWYFTVLIPYIICGIYVYRIIGKKMGNLKPAAIGYIFIILLMSITCFFAVISGNYKLLPAFLGTIFFMVSDTVLAYSMFVSKNKYSDITVMATYVTAQMLIIIGFLNL